LASWGGMAPLPAPKSAYDVTVVCALTVSYTDSSATDVGSAAELATVRKDEKCVVLNKTHLFQYIAVNWAP